MVTPDTHASHSAFPDHNRASRGFDAAVYVDQTAALMALTIPPTLRTSVIANFEHICEIAQPLVEFALPETIESAAVFEP